MTIYMKFTNEAEAKTILTDYLDEDGNWITGSHTHALDVVGLIHKPTGVMLTDEGGNQYPDMAPIDGFHVNFIGELQAAAESFVIAPSTPSRVFA